MSGLLKVIGLLLAIALGDRLLELAKRLEELIYYDNGGFLKAGIFIAIWLISLLALFIGAFHPSMRFRVVYFVVLFISTIVGVGYELLTGSTLTYDSVETLLNAREFAGEAAGFYGSRLIYPLGIALLLAVVLLPVSAKVSHLYKNKYVLAGVFAFLPIAILFALALLRGGYGLDHTPHAFRTATLASMIGMNKIVFEEPVRDTVTISRNEKHARPDIVLIVDESVRADYLDLNNDRGATPYLKSRENEIFNFGYAVSAANCSHTSNQLLRMGPDQGDVETTLLSNPYIWMYAREAGYRTVLIDAQAKPGQISSNNGVSTQEQSYIDAIVYPEEATYRDEDLNIASLIRVEQMRADMANQPAFIYVVKNGVHFPYGEVLPAEVQESTLKEVVGLSEKKKLEAWYLAAVKYTIDDFFAALLGEGSDEETVVIYTSDHGQNLLDNGLMITHCGDNNIDWREGLVPLLMLTEIPALQKQIAQAVQFNKNQVSHYNLFPTLLNLMGFSVDEVSERYGKDIFAKLNEPRSFISGTFAMNRLSLGGRTQLKWNKFPDIDSLNVSQK